MIRKYLNSTLPSPARKRFVLSSFKGVDTRVAEEKLPFSYAPKSYNFAFEKGVLETGTGMSAAVMKVNGRDWEIQKAAGSGKFLRFFSYTMHSGQYRQDRLVAYADDGKLYDLRFNALTAFAPVGSYGEVLCAVPYTFEGNEGLLFSSTQGLYYLSGLAADDLGMSEPIDSMCVHSERVFACFKNDPFKLRFSDDFDPSNWNVSLREGGYISFTAEMGRIIKVVSFGGYLYVFFEHGIARITAFNDQTQFSVKKLYLSVGLINKDTITVCGDRILFSAADGVYVFDGLSVGKVLKELEGLFSEAQPGSNGAFHNGKYYLACSLDMDSSIVNAPNSLLIYDVWTGKTEIAHDLTISCMIGVNNASFSGVMAEANYPVNFLGLIDRSGSVNSTVTYKLWRSPLTSFGSNRGRKMLREIRVRAEGNATITVELDGSPFAFPIHTGLNKIRVRRLFDKLSVAISSESESVRVTEADMVVDFFGD